METNPSSPSIQSHFQTRNSMAVDNGSESDGFVSGEEEFETPMAYPLDKFAFGDTPFVNSRDFFTTFDDGPSDFDGIVGGKENEVNNGSDEVHTRVYGASNSDDTFWYTKPELGDGNGDFVEASSDSDDDKGLESGKFVEENEVKVNDLVDDKEEVATEESNSSEGVDTRGAGDSIIETLHVDLLAPGVAVAGEKVEVEGSEIKGFEGKACGLSLDNEFDSLEQIAEEASDKLPNGDTGGDQSVDTGADEDGSERAEKGEECDIAIIQKDENSAFTSDSVKSLQDDITNEAHDVAEADQNVDIGADGDDSGHAEKGHESDIAIVQKDEDSELVSDKVKADINIEANADEPLLSRTGIAVIQKAENSEFASDTEKSVQDDTNKVAHAGEGGIDSHVKASGDSLTSEHVNPGSSWIRAISPIEDEEGEHHPGVREIDVSVSVGEGEEMIVESSESAKLFSEHVEQQSGVGSHSGADTSQGLSHRIDGQIVTDSEEEGNTDDEGNNQLIDSDVLAALLKAGAGQDGGGITISSRDGPRLFSVERPAGLGTSLQSSKPAAGLNHANSFTSSISRPVTNYAINLSEEDKKKLEKLQQIRIKFLRLVQRLGFTPEESIAAQVLFRLTTLAGRYTGQLFSSEAAMESAYQLEAERRDDLNFYLNILVLGKTGVGKSATINSIFGEMKTSISAYGPSTAAVTEIVGMVDGVKLRIFDTPGLKSSALEHGFNSKVLSVVKKVIKKSPPDIVLYVDRLDMQTRDLNDVPMLKLISSALGPSIWRNVVIALTHAASAPPDGSSGSPLSYDVFLAQRSTSVQQSVGQAAGEFRIMNPEIREMKQKGKTAINDYGDMEDDQENGSPTAVAVPLPDMTLPPTFDNDIPAYRYRFLEPTSQLLTRPVLVTQSWDHDCGYDGVNLEHSLAIVNKFPVAVTAQMTKDKKDFSIHLDSSAATKHGENGSSMASLNVQNIGKQIAYILRGETEFKNFKRNKTAAGLCVSFLGESISTGLKVEDQIVLGKRLALVGSSGIMRSKGDSVYGTNVEVRLREADFPIGQDQSSLSLNLVKWRGDLALGANFQSQFSIGRNYKMAVNATMNNRQSGQISVRTSSSDQLQISLLAILPIARAIYKNFWPKSGENHSIY
ncbi:putative small monomeric GTPase [Lupinus albus]|uniref:Putative small monomeric GTPase n=1 Tax=Lupinus albus TaxID=3870 RepID=A0A6A4NRL3_LUPAL|nr:putative small monomeric GTPase [Lupinus albus]